MALAFWVDGRPGSVASAMCAHDEYLSLFAYHLSGGRGRGGAPRHFRLTPDDDFYSAPYCFMPKHRRGGFLVFTTRVPWLHGNPLGEADRAHDRARETMESRGKYEKPFLGTVEKFMVDLGLKERDVYTFTDDGCYPTQRDISQALEDRAVEVTCAAMGWKAPTDWRQVRKKEGETHGMPLLDLADWDKRKRSNEGPDDDDDETRDDAARSSKDDKQRVVDRQEEKKDEFQC
eukprot:CAMPEP_0172552560 /NCGR_PEP_ID=MMETSP1067-20121228/45836_1 /TAXON_ID=265564 ORGANISM="Thalassiosira punctigera, Strain Tpunct2005C2" /NCGR_SAMPLE_ID=MMETSP1067 /ASSEMBLY_ACC=CAM_ASM_000444 /LENGTH=231 /DNA_ID=CAMNT_0013340563 /DNA_START=175 /DNA_END=870 /DNA_ORIENTATION=-